jgi:hypothetical protein
MNISCETFYLREFGINAMEWIRMNSLGRDGQFFLRRLHTNRSVRARDEVPMKANVQMPFLSSCVVVRVGVV